MSAVLKIERADHHIEQFEAIFRTYVMDNVKALRPEPNPNRWEKRSLGGRLPRHTPTIVGDAIHNLRTSLDHAYCALVEANGGAVNRYTKFPFGKDRQSTEGTINGQEATALPHAKVIQFVLDVVKPFEAQGGELHGVHLLDVADKHHSLIGTDAVVMIERLDWLDANGRMTGGGMRDLDIVVPYGQQMTGLNLPKGFGAKLSGDPKDAFAICFAKGQPFEDASIIDTLKRLSVVTHNTVVALSKF